MTETHYPLFGFQVVVPLVLVVLGVLVSVALEYRDRNVASYPTNVRHTVGRALALACAVAVVVLVIVLLRFNPYSSFQASVSNLNRFTPMLASAALAGAGGAMGRRSLLVSAFATGFFPFWLGPYLLGSPGIFKWIPIAQFGYLLAAWLIATGRKRPVDSEAG